MEKIEKALDYYKNRQKSLIDGVNGASNSSIHYIIKCGVELNELDIKIAALEIAKNN